LLRPWLLLLIPLGLLLVWAAQRRGGVNERLVDPALRDYALVERNPAARRRRSALLALMVLLAGVSLSGPGWRHIELPAKRTANPTYILLDLSYSMAATDLQPSRYKRAVFAVRDLLRNNPGSAPFALIVFAGDAYQVAPLSYDLATMDNFLDVLDPQLLPSGGSNPLAALELVAANLAANDAELAATPTLVLVSDDLSTQRAKIVEMARSRGWRLALIAVGRSSNVPVAGPDGELLRDSSGKLRLAAYTPDSFIDIARELGAELASIDGRLGRLADLRLAHKGTTKEEIQRRQPADLGYLFALALLPLLLLSARRGMFALVLMITLGSVTSQTALAFGWKDLWQSDHNQAGEALRKGDFDHALELSDDPLVTGSARYKQGDYAGALADFSRVQSAPGKYNAGNAAYALREYQRAIDLYTNALELNPEEQLREDIAHNLALARESLEQQQNQEQKQQHQSSPESQQQSQQEKQQGQQGQSQQQRNQGNEQENQQENQPTDQQQSNQQTDESQAQEQAGQEANQSPPQSATYQQEQGEQGESSADQQITPSSSQQDASADIPDSGESQKTAQIKEQTKPLTDASADAAFGELQSRGALLLNSVEDNPAELLRRMFWLQQQRQGNRQTTGEPEL